jgi:tetratricopeptide (TPR) repeat protein
MAKRTYLNFDLLIYPDDNGYHARLLHSPVGEGATVQFALPFGEDELRAFLGVNLEGMRHVRISTPANQASGSLTPQDFGERLFAAVFAGNISNALQRSLDEARRQQAGLRIRLRLDANAPGLAALPWEYLYAKPPLGFLALSDRTVLLRYVELDQPPQPLQATLPLHVLAVVANPTDLPQLDVEGEWRQLEQALQPLQRQGLIRLERLEQATIANLQERLQQDDVHILHFIGHGYFDPAAQTGGLAFENDQGESHSVETGRFVSLLADCDALKLVFLNACEGARSSQMDFFAGTAQQIVRYGVPAVVAMQFPVRDTIAVKLSRAFYGALAAGHAADAAVAAARKATFATGNDREWATPVLFSRSPNNQLFLLPERHSFTRQLARQWPLYTLAGLAILATTSVLWATLLRNPSLPEPEFCTDQRQCVLVADFDPPGSKHADDTTRKIRSALRDRNLLSPATFAVMDAPVVANPDQASQLAGRERALLIVWGQINETFQQLDIHFELADQFGVGESHQIRPYRVHFFDSVTQKVTCKGSCFTDFTHVADVLDQLSRLIADTAAGMLHYANGQPEDADHNFLAALTCSGQPIPSLEPQIEATRVPSVTVATPTCPALVTVTGFEPAALYYYAGKSKILTGDYRAAIAHLQQAARANPTDPAAWIGIATAYQSWLGQSDASESLDALALARERTEHLRRESFQPQQTGAIEYELGLIAELAGDQEAARARYADAVTQFGRRSPAAYVSLVALGRLQVKAGQSAAAINTLSSARDLNQAAPWAYLELAKVHEGNRALADHQLELARRAAPNEAYVDITEAELCTEEWDDRACAAEAYARALQKRPDSGWLHSRIGVFYLPTNPPLPGQNWENAREHLAKAALLRPNDPWAHERLAYVLHNLGEYGQAIAEYEQAIALVYGPAQAAGLYCNVGRSYQLAGEVEQARQNYERCEAQARNNELRARAAELLRQLGP